MALNFKTLGTRALSALFFVALLLGCLLWNYYSFTIFFFVVAMIGLNEFYRLSEKMDAKPYKIAGYLMGVLSYASFVKGFYFLNLFPAAGKSVLLIIPFVLLTVSLFTERERAFRNALFTLGGIIYAVLPFGLMHYLVAPLGHSGQGIYYPYILLGIILLIWSNDTFAYLGGSLLGKNKMIERVSPGKTWEGTAVGVILTIGSGYIIGRFILRDMVPMWTLFGALIPIFATIGDLIESMLKREAGVKDSGSIMPGHGGVLDRFDSLIFVTPFVFLLMDVLALNWR